MYQFCNQFLVSLPDCFDNRWLKGLFPLADEANEGKRVLLEEFLLPVNDDTVIAPVTLLQLVEQRLFR